MTKKQININVTEDTYDRLKVWADIFGTSRSQFVLRVTMDKLLDLEMEKGKSTSIEDIKKILIENKNLIKKLADK